MVSCLVRSKTLNNNIYNAVEEETQLGISLNFITVIWLWSMIISPTWTNKYNFLVTTAAVCNLVSYFHREQMVLGRNYTRSVQNIDVSAHPVVVSCLLKFSALQHVPVWFLLGWILEFPREMVLRIITIGISIPHLPCNSKPARQAKFDLVHDCWNSSQNSIFLADMISLYAKNKWYLAIYSPHWSWGRWSLEMKSRWPFRTKISINGLNGNRSFRLSFNAKLTASFLQLKSMRDKYGKPCNAGEFDK